MLIRMAKHLSQTVKRRRKTSKLLIAVSCGLASGQSAVSLTLLTVSQLIFTSKKSATVKSMASRSSKAEKSFLAAWIVAPYMTTFTSQRQTNGSLGLILAIKMRLTSSPRTPKFRT
jgi:hypothetical protein